MASRIFVSFLLTGCACAAPRVLPHDVVSVVDLGDCVALALDHRSVFVPPDDSGEAMRRLGAPTTSAACAQTDSTSSPARAAASG